MLVKLIVASAAVVALASSVSASTQQQVSASSFGSITPIQESTIPSWASSSDVCILSKDKSCDSCETETNQYCRYNQVGEPSCCTQTTKTGVSSDDADAANVQAQSAPFSIVDRVAGTFDFLSKLFFPPSSPIDCTQQQPEAAAAVSSSHADDVEQGIESFGQIQPVEYPAGSSDSDVCVAVSSCDSDCNQSTTSSPSQYCKFTSTGAQTCCTIAASASASTSSPKAEQLAAQSFGQASITPIKQDRLAGASSTDDVCRPSASCDDCPSDSNNHYCFYSAKGQANCCAAAATSTVTSPPGTAAVLISELKTNTRSAPANRATRM